MMVQMRSLATPCKTEWKDTAGQEKEALIIPDSYDQASIEVDSAFTPYDDPQFYELTIELAKDGTAIEQAKSKDLVVDHIDTNRSVLSI
jgi:hypothetical protein